MSNFFPVLKRMKSTVVMGFLIAFIGGVTGCASTGPHEFKTPPQTSKEGSVGSTASFSPTDPNIGSKLAPGYLLRLSSLEDKKLNGEFRIDFDGWLRLPYDVSFKASGLTLDEAIKKIQEGYRPFFKGAPSIQVELTQRKLWVDVRGLVKKPGKYLILSDAGIDEILAQVEGFLPNANVDAVRIDRGEETISVPLGSYFVSGQTLSLPRWVGGERLFFHSSLERSQFYDENQNSKSIEILGEVRKPGYVPYRQGADFLYYYSAAEGSTALANLGKIEIIRNSIPHSESITVDFAEKNSIPPLSPGDMVVVHADRPSALERSAPVLTAIASVLSAFLLSVLVLR
jgi:protein involved in polysaccharide export with SLBB domain